MPFQISVSQNSEQTEGLSFVDAGDNLSTLCGNEITLNANIGNASLDGHTAIWEQISGSEVEFITSIDQLEVTFTQDNFDDKSFRFTVDAGTIDEVSDEVIVYGSPFEEVFTGIHSSNNMQFNYGESLNVDSPNLSLLTPFPFEPHDGSGISNVYTEATLSWNIPKSLHNLLYFIIRERDNITEITSDIGIVSRDERYFDGITLGNTYSIVAVYRARNSRSFQVTSNTIWLNGNISNSGNAATISGIDAITTSITHNQKPIVENYNQEINRLLFHSTVDELSYNINSNANSIVVKNFNQNTFRLISHPLSDDRVYFTVGINNNSQTIFNYNQIIVSNTQQVGG